MKIAAVLLIVMSGLLTGCIVAEPEYRGDGYGDRNSVRGDRDRNAASPRGDRDRDGVPNSQDRRPDDPRRY
jgi:hypothetical protein